MNSGEIGAFESVAPYLKDPLILIGFVLFIGFLLARQVLRSGLVPTLTQSMGARVVRLLLQYGFLLALSVIVLGFGIRYYEIHENKQRIIEKQLAASDLIGAELCANRGTMIEIGESVDSLNRARSTLVQSLRDRRFPIASMLFGEKLLTLSPGSEASGAAALVRYDELSRSGYLDNPEVCSQHMKLCGAIKTTIERTRSTLASLADTSEERFRVASGSWDSHQAMLTSLAKVDLDRTASLYETMKNVRKNYTRFSSATLEYIDSVSAFCGQMPTEHGLSAVLSSEQILVSMSRSLAAGIAQLIESADKSLTTLNKRCVGRLVQLPDL